MTEPPFRGRNQDIADATLVCIPSGGQWRRVKLPVGLITNREAGNGQVFQMRMVPVVSSVGIPLMPCHPARARELIRTSKAIRRFNKGLFYIKLLDRTEGRTQPIALGIDPGSKKEGYSLVSTRHHLLNIQADAVTWVKRNIETRRIMRRNRRSRNTPYRKCRSNRSTGGLVPSTKARWQWKLRIAKWLSLMYPISVFVVEDIKAESRKNCRKWNRSFNPLQVGKNWFYQELSKLGNVQTKQGWETKALRDQHGLKKLGNKMSDSFYAHCVDSFVLANNKIDGNPQPTNESVIQITPIQLHRRWLHDLIPKKGGKRRLYGGTRSISFKRGSWVNHPKYGTTYVGGNRRGKISLHSLETGERLCTTIKSSDCQLLCYSVWRMH